MGIFIIFIKNLYRREIKNANLCSKTYKTSFSILKIADENFADKNIVAEYRLTKRKDMRSLFLKIKN